MGQVAPTPARPSNSDPQSIALQLALQRIFAGNRASDERFNLARMNLQDSASNRQALAQQNQQAITARQQEHDQTRADAKQDEQERDQKFRADQKDKDRQNKLDVVDARNQVLKQRQQNQKQGVDPNLLFFPSGSPSDPTMNGQDSDLQKQGWVAVGIQNNPKDGKPSVVYAKQGSVYTDPQNGDAALQKYVTGNPQAAPNVNGPNTGPQQGAQLGSQPKFTPGGASDTTAKNAIDSDLATNPSSMNSRGELADAIERIAGVDPSQQLFNGQGAVQGKDMGNMGGQVIPGAYNPTAISPEAMRTDVPAGPSNGNVTVLPVKPQTGTDGLTVRYQSSLDKVPAQYQAAVQKAADAAGVHPDVVASLLHQESGFNPNAVSPAGAVGIGQFMPGTAAEYGINPRDPNASITATGKYLAKSLAKYDGNIGLALASYNGGTGVADNFLKTGKLNSQTAQYVKAITGQPLDAWVGNKGDVTVTGNAGTKVADSGTSQAGSAPGSTNAGGDPRMQQLLASAQNEDDNNLNSLDQIRALYAGSMNGIA